MSALSIAVDQDFASGVGRVEVSGRLDDAGAGRLRDAILKCAAAYPTVMVIGFDGVGLPYDRPLAVLVEMERRLGQDEVGLVLYAEPDSPVGQALRRLIGPSVPVYPDASSAEAAAAVISRKPGRVHARLPADADSPAAARALVARACTNWGVEGLIGDAQLIVSELVSNAVLHAGTDLELTLVRRPWHLIIQVRDRGSGRPRPAAKTDLSQPSGRGLMLVEHIAAAWGVSDVGLGKTVWASLRLRPAAAAS